VLVRRGAPPDTSTSTGNTQLAAVQASERTLDIASLRAALAAFARQNSPVASSLLPIVDRAGNDINKALKGIEGWFATGMESVSGWYKTRARRQLFAIGFVLAVLANVDAIDIFRHLNAHPEDAARLAELAREADRAGAAPELKSIETLPIGYECLSVAANPDVKPSPWKACTEELGNLRALAPSEWALKLLGWLITAFAGSMGASYWFAAVSKVVNIRSSGPPPASKPS
jgi:hypothetical protein